MEKVKLGLENPLTNRLRYIDFFRGLAIVNMVIYHLLFDLKYIFLVDMPFFSISSWFVYQQYIGMSFIFISGISSHYSKNLLKNGLKLLGISMLISIVTALISSDIAIYFGVLHFLSLGMILLHFYKKVELKKSPQHYQFIFIASLLVFIMAYRSYLIEDSVYINLYPYVSKLPFSFIIGFPDESFHSSDYYPLFPWMFLMFSGYFFSKTKYSALIESAFIKVRLFYKLKFVETIGMHSQVIYLSHQIILCGFLYLIFFLIG